jgi:hypothetical protein
MSIKSHSKRRRLWARGSLIVAASCFVASAVIWLSHWLQYLLFGAVSHTTIAAVLGVNDPALQVTICLALPVLGLLALYVFLGVWVVGVYRGWRRARSSAR